MFAELPGEDSNAQEQGKITSLSRAVDRLAQEAREAISSPFGFGRRIRDVTTEFGQATARLQRGQLVKDEVFTLFEAVGAIEIMDSKMDSGCVPPGDKFMSDFEVSLGREASEIVWIMDHLLYLETIWHEGFPLSQTIFSSLHIDRLLNPDNAYPYAFHLGGSTSSDPSISDHLTNKVLRAFCVGQVKCCQLVLQTIQSQNFYEEEDFVTHLFGRELLPKLKNAEAGRLLDQAMTWLDEVDLPEPISQALLLRLRLRKRFLSSAGGDELGWHELKTIVQQIQESHTLGTAIPEAFSDKVQRQLATSTPPRPMLVLTWDEACRRWIKMFDDIKVAVDLTSVSVCQSPAALQRATWAFSYLNPQPNTYARAYFQELLFGNDRITEEITHFDLLLTDIRDLVLAGDPFADPQSFQVEMPTDPRHICARQIEAFMDKAFDEYMNLYRMVCQNRCRIRRTFTQAIPIMDNIECEAEKADQILREVTDSWRRFGDAETANKFQPLANWTKYHKLQLMAWTVQLGFETDIYLPDELCEMYRLLYTFDKASCELVDEIDSVLLDRMKGLTKTRNTKYVIEAIASQDWIRSLKLRRNITCAMSRALSRFYGVLNGLKVIKPPKRGYAVDDLLWEARMKPFLAVTNDHLLGDGKAPKALGSIQEASHDIEADIRNAKALLQQLKKVTPEQGKYVGTEEQWKREIKQWETTCVATAVQASQLLRIAELARKDKDHSEDDLEAVIELSIPPPGKRYHEWWVVPQIKAKS